MIAFQIMILSVTHVFPQWGVGSAGQGRHCHQMGDNIFWGYLRVQEKKET